MISAALANWMVDLVRHVTSRGCLGFRFQERPLQRGQVSFWLLRLRSGFSGLSLSVSFILWFLYSTDLELTILSLIFLSVWWVQYKGKKEVQH